MSSFAALHVLTDHSALVVLWSQRTERESTVSAHSAASDAHWTSTKAEGTADLVNCGRSVLEPTVVGGSCAQLELFQVLSHKGAKVKAVRAVPAGTVYSTPLAPFVEQSTIARKSSVLFDTACSV